MAPPPEPAEVSIPEPKSVALAPKPRASVVGFTVRFLWPHRGLVGLLFFGLLIDIAFTAGVPIAIQALIDKALIPRDTHVLKLVLGALAVSTLIASLAGAGRDVLYA